MPWGWETQLWCLTMEIVSWSRPMSLPLTGKWHFYYLVQKPKGPANLHLSSRSRTHSSEVWNYYPINDWPTVCSPTPYIFIVLPNMFWKKLNFHLDYVDFRGHHGFMSRIPCVAMFRLLQHYCYNLVKVILLLCMTSCVWIILQWLVVWSVLVNVGA